MRLARCAVTAVVIVSACQYQASPATPPEATPPFAGTVTLVWAPTSWAVLANFTELEPGDGGCPGTQVGACCAYSQPAIHVGAGGAASVSFGAGTVAIDDGTAAIGTLDFGGFGYLPLSSDEAPDLSWNPGDVIGVRADGGTVEPFVGAVTAPQAFAGVTPPLALDSQVVIRLERDFTVTWQAIDGGGSVTLSLFDPSGFYVDCSAPESAGSVTAPADALSIFLSGDNGYATLTRSNDVQVQSTNATIDIQGQATDPGLVHFE